MLDLKRFKKSKIKLRQAAVPVPALAWLAKEGEDPVWTVEALTGQRLAAARDAAASRDPVKPLIDALKANNAEGVESEVLKLFEDQHKSADLAYRMTMLRLCSVNPICDRDAALKMACFYPVTFYQLTNKILEISDMGEVEDKKKDSQKIQESEQP